MPELPEVETVRRGLAPWLEGARILSVDLRRPDLRFPLPAGFRDRIEGATVRTLSRRAKYMLATLSTGETMIMHLGMTGRFVVEAGDGVTAPGDFYDDSPRLAAHDHLVLTLATSDGRPARLVYNDVRRFGFIDLCSDAALAGNPHLASLGAEPLDDAFDAAALARLFEGRTTTLKAALLDQRLVAGLGNIYVCEALHRAGLSPRRKAGSLVTRAGAPRAGLERLAGEIRAVLGEAIAAGGSTLRDYVAPDGARGGFQQRFLAYDREGEPCRREGCAGLIRRFVQNGRSTFHCAACQR
jgi:formamidopyrimidine-DNA glycosylase